MHSHAHILSMSLLISYYFFFASVELGKPPLNHQLKENKAKLCFPVFSFSFQLFLGFEVDLVGHLGINL